MRNFNDEEIHCIQTMARSHNFDVFINFLNENYEDSLEKLVDENCELIRGEAIGLRHIIRALKEAVEFKSTELSPVENDSKILITPGIASSYI